MPGAGIRTGRQWRLLESRGAAAALLVCFSLLYFADICLRASEKYFWFDELITVYLSRLPNMRAVYRATLMGVDYNPPLFHILSRLAEVPFGEGLITSRLPSIVGVWLLCVCMFAFVSKRSGPAAGSVAMLLPLLSSVRFYAYEARAYGIVLGLAALAAVSWQQLAESRYRKAWLGLFGMSLLAAFLNHCYAITLLFPFGCAEAFRSWRKRRLDRAPWVMMGCAALVASAFYVPLLRSFKQHVGAGFYPPDLGSLQAFYNTLLAPAMLVLVACLAAFAVASTVAPDSARVVIPGADIVLALSFLVLPAVGLVLAAAIHGPFIGRYWYSTLLGVCLAAGFASGGWAKWMAPSLAILLALLVTGDFALLVRHRVLGVGEALVDPNTLLPMNTTPGQPLRAYEGLWANAPGDAPIVVTGGLEFAFLAHYAPPQTRSRLYYLRRNGSDLVGDLLQSLHDCCRFSYKFTYAQDFSRVTPHFYVYGNSHDPLASLLQGGAHMLFRASSLGPLGDHVIVEVIHD